jgi:NAD(P)-dependent dehydrogenase (short-subunit alcohol dehydrogenase family)
MTSKQVPIQSGFGFSNTAAEVLKNINLEGKTAIVTGGYSGIGLETTRALADAGATVVVPAKTHDKARQALNGIARVEQKTLDLLDPASIDAFADSFIRSGRPLHLLINNAGVMATPLLRDARGYEGQFSANHLGHFQLTARLWPALKQASGARVVTLSSGAHRFNGIDFDDIHFERREYDKWASYAQSKTANVLFTLALDGKGAEHGVRGFAVHPGRILTDLPRSIPMEELQALGFLDKEGKIPADQAHLYKTPAQGAATTTWCATSPALNGMGGVYCEDVDIALAMPADHAPWDGVLPWAIDAQAAQRLWEESERLTGVRFG